ncbi:hypothetical protein [Roseovarius sp. D0-M9]|uniref:hypothetical protein n=1 Tax=Roseovarius sp. D0-M9 TaxID=3127117 RepID=UPI00300FFD39
MHFVKHHLIGKLAVPSVGYVLLTLMLTFQIVAASVVSATQASHRPADIVMDHSDHQGMQPAAVQKSDCDAPKLQNLSESTDHCAPSICCFHSAFAPIDLDMTGVLLAATRAAEYSVVLPSYRRSTKDRPPQLI